MDWLSLIMRYCLSILFLWLIYSDKKKIKANTTVANNDDTMKLWVSYLTWLLAPAMLIFRTTLKLVSRLRTAKEYRDSKWFAKSMKEFANDYLMLNKYTKYKKDN